MITVLDSEPLEDELHVRELLTFCLDHGFDKWCFGAIGRAGPRAEVLRLHLAGVPCRMGNLGALADLTGTPRTQFWEFNSNTADILLTFSASFLTDPEFGWYFKGEGKGSLLARGTPRRVLLYIDSSKQQALYRRGFRFTVEESNGKSRPFTAEDSEEKQSIVSRAKSIDLILSSPYGLDSFPPRYRSRVNHMCADNPYILKWWTAEHDQVLKVQIERGGAAWWPAVSALVSLAGASACHRWQREDPSCRTRNSGEVLQDFARARAEAQGFTKTINFPARCSTCNRDYDPALIGLALSKKLNNVANRVCDYCLYEAFLGNGNDSATASEVIDFLHDISDAIGRVPSSTILSDSTEVSVLPSAQLLPAIQALKRRPTRERVNELFGSWLHALVAAQLLGEPARRTSRGTQCIADDGHLCLSLAEKTIDDFLSQNRVLHEREVPYADGRFRCDFLAKDTLIEYFGMIGDARYDERHEAKLRYCLEVGIKLVCLYPEDVIDRASLRKKLQSIL